MEPAPAGWTRYLMKSKSGVGRDFSVLDGDEQQVFYVDGKVGPRPKADVQDASGTVTHHVVGQLLGIPKKMSITDASGAELASMKAKMFSPVKSHIDIAVAAGDPWVVEGSFVEKDYHVSSGGRPIVEISQKWVTVRDTYTLDVIDGIDPAFALAVVWAIDRWVERD